MFGYRVKASYSGYGNNVILMIACHAGSKRDVEAELQREGWIVKSVKSATEEDLLELKPSHEVLEFIKRDIRRLEELERQKEEREEAERRKREVARWKAAEAAERAREMAREAAISAAAGDILRIDPEPSVKGNPKVASICAKASLFFGHANVNRKDLFTSISIDFADFQSQWHFPHTTKMVELVVKDLNDHLRIDEELSVLGQRLQYERTSAENKINSIASRTHVFGGSGEWLLLSALAANSAARNDERAIQSLQDQHAHLVQQADRIAKEAAVRKQLLEFRVTTAVAVLKVACGKAAAINLDIHPSVEEFVLSNSQHRFA